GRRRVGDVLRRAIRFTGSRRVAVAPAGAGMTTPAPTDRRNLAVIKALTYLMFAMFAMTTDSVGIIIPEIIKTFRLTLTAAGTFQSSPIGAVPGRRSWSG